jgi:hypothetical protein
LGAAACGIDAAGEARTADLEARDGLVRSDHDCHVTSIPARQILCDSAKAPADDTLWRMGRLDDLA